MPLLNPSSVVMASAEALQTEFPIMRPGGRLSLSSSSAVADVANSFVCYYLPYRGNLVPLWNSEYNFWVYRSIPEAGVTIASTQSVGTYDVYAFLNPSTNLIGISTQIWTNSTTRFRPLSLKHGIPVIALGGTSNVIATYLGSVRSEGTPGNGLLNDYDSKRFVTNAYNKVRKRVLMMETVGSWQSSGTAWQAMNSKLTNRIEVLSGDGEDVVDVTYNLRGNAGAAPYGGCGIGFDTTVSPEVYGFSNVGDLMITCRLTRPVPVGYHYLQPLHLSTSGTPITFFGGGNSMIIGTWFC